MTPAQKRTHIQDIAIALGDPKAAERFSAARKFLQAKLAVRREIPNGMDFLFSGETAPLLSALKDLVEIEHRASRFLLIDYAKIDDYLLLRVIAGPEHRKTIEGYFD